MTTANDPRAVGADAAEILAEIDYYNSLPFTFDGHIDLNALPANSLTDGEIYLVCVEKQPANPEKKYLPGYEFVIAKGFERVGRINLRIGYGGGPHNANLYYGGQIGYDVDEPHRGNGYAARACSLLVPVAKAHDMHTLLITNNVTNQASIRVCEKLGARLVRTPPLPEWNELYQEPHNYREINIYEWKI